MNKQVQTPEQPAGNRIDERAERVKQQRLNRLRGQSER